MNSFSYFETVKGVTSLDGLTGDKALVNPLGRGRHLQTLKDFLFYGSQSALNFGFPVIGSGKELVRRIVNLAATVFVFRGGFFFLLLLMLLLVTCCFRFLFSFE